MKTTLLLAVLVVAGALLITIQARADLPKAGDTAPLFTGQDQDGKEFKLADHIGKTGIIFDQKDAFAHDCPSTPVCISRDASAPTTASRAPSSPRLSGAVRG